VVEVEAAVCLVEVVEVVGVAEAGLVGLVANRSRFRHHIRHGRL
jgi:hypothetical protein